MAPERNGGRNNAELNLSAFSLLDKSTLYSIFFPLSKIRQIATLAGYSGLEWMPCLTLAGIQLEQSLTNPNDKALIKSGHQSFRSEKSLKEVWQHPNRVLAIFAFILLPERVISLNNLEKVQAAVGKKLPVVLYPPHSDKEESGTKRPFAEKLFQPTPDVMARWSVSTPEELIEVARQLGYTGFCLDTKHIRAPAKPGKPHLNPWRSTLPELLPFTKEIHVSAGRTDIPGSHEITMAELQDLLDGTNYTDLPKILQMIKTLGWKGRVVTEIPAAALFVLATRKGILLSIEKLVEQHKKIVGNVAVWLGI